jgi:SAM-dependent methyltransferase
MGPSRLLLVFLAGFITLAMAVRVAVVPATSPEKNASDELDVEYEATPNRVVDVMLQLADPQLGDLLYDLGCGDGRIVVTAAERYDITAVGVDLDPERVAESRAKAVERGVDDRVTITQADLFQFDFSDAQVVALYLLPEINEQLIPQFLQLAPGTRIVSHNFGIPGYRPDQSVRIEAEGEDDEYHVVYLWTTPLKELGSTP